ncbi:hypothetical protein O181_030602 [Austropuccinia psidii MF-1]|uniref:Uncharacterized protein n=1 Tax=Austropuccinia psidii MF-1 TaxID=1389203 RepID=A0A9Q3H4K5_9BASI|nr:hypothetical protein [Austropuccinia psidii MF-1]
MTSFPFINLEMSSKLTELTESSSSVLCGSGIFSQLGSPQRMASSGNFDPHQTYDGYEVVELFDPPFSEFLMKGKQCFQHFNLRSSKCHYCFVGKNPCQCPGVPLSTIKRYLWRKKDGPFGKEFPVYEAPNPDGTSGYSSSEVSISRINTQGVIKRIRKIYDSSTHPDAERSDECYGEEVEVINSLVGHFSSSSHTQPPEKKLHSQLIPNTPRNFQPFLFPVPSSVPHPSPKSSTSRPILASKMNSSPITQPRSSPVLTSHQLQTVARASQRRDDWSPLPFPDSQVFQNWEHWPIRVNREDPAVGNEGQDAVAKLFRKVDRNIREVIVYASDRMIPGTPSEGMAAKFSCSLLSQLLLIQNQNGTFQYMIWEGMLLLHIR